VSFVLMRGVSGNVSRRGYHVAEINRSGTYLITDGGSQAWAIVTQRGVILVDVPEPPPFPQANEGNPGAGQGSAPPGATSKFSRKTCVSTSAGNGSS
jgi:hypothetical protein